VFPLGRMEWDYERILGGGGVSSVVIPDLSWEMGPRSDFGMMYGAVTCPLEWPSRSYMI
jgi:hypothetical protein